MMLHLYLTKQYPALRDCTKMTGQYYDKLHEFSVAGSEQSERKPSGTDPLNKTARLAALRGRVML